MNDFAGWQPQQQTLDHIDWLLAGLIEQDAAPGVAYGIFNRDGLIHTAGIGTTKIGAQQLPTEHTAFRIASMTKSFTAAAIMLLVERGDVELDRAVHEIVPEVPGPPHYCTDAPPMTVRMLLSMSGGLANDDPWGDRQESISVEQFGQILSEPIAFIAAPDTRYEYANLGYAILGRVVEVASGQPYVDFVTEQILAPLDLSATGFDSSVNASDGVADGHARIADQWRTEPVSQPGVFSAIGGVFSTVSDLTTWTSWLCSAFPARDGADDGPLSRAGRRLMQQAHRVMPLIDYPVTDDRLKPSGLRFNSYGFGVIVTSDQTFGEIVSHSGGYPGFGSHMRWHPQTGIGLIALANGRYAPCSIVGDKAMQALLDDALSAGTPLDVWTRTREAQEAVMAFLRARDFAVLDGWLSENVEMDIPLDVRLQEISGQLDALGSSDWTMVDVRSHSPAQLVWDVSGGGETIRCEIAMHPILPALIQTLKVTPPADNIN